jgi:hypothetical protein
MYYVVSLLLLFAHFFVMSYVVKGVKPKQKRAVKSE